MTHRSRTCVAVSLLCFTGAMALAATAPPPDERAGALLAEQVAEWKDPDARAASIAELRAFNPEWDFMRRTFLALALADRALAAPDEADAHLAVIDDILATTLADEFAHGHGHFLLPYANRAPWKDPAARSLFVDGEIALMIGARRLVREDAELAKLHRERVDAMVAAFGRSPALLPESYPDEAWLFCNTNALVAIRMADVLDGTDHGALIDAWTANARARLVEPATGMLGSEFTWDGRMNDGPEGSSVWLVATNLLLLDRELADAQYEAARASLVHEAAGIAWASEWGPGWQGPADVDSGPIVPGFDASPSSSGFALLASRAFDDDATHGKLVRALSAADLLVRVDPRMAALADNDMGDVIVLHALTFGPLWERIGPRDHS